VICFLSRSGAILLTQNEHFSAVPSACRTDIAVFMLANNGHGRNITGRAQYDSPSDQRPVWNAGKDVRAKRALKQKQIWQICFYLDNEDRLRD
jgi:hypothetical protein